MNDFISQNLKNLKDSISKSNTDIGIYILNSEKGIGKTTLVKEFYKEISISDTLFISHTPNTAPLQEIYLELLNVYKIEKFNENESCVSFHEYLMISLFEYIKEGNIKYICFDSLNLFELEEISFIFSIIDLIKNNLVNKKVVFICTIDGKISSLLHSFFVEKSKYTYYIELFPWNTYSLKQFFKEYYTTFIIDDQQLDQIILYSFNNVECFLSNIEYLKSKNIIVFENNHWKCNNIPNDFLLCNYQHHIYARYKMLDPALRDVLQKAAIIGQEFSFKILENPLQVAMANKALDEIENISRLINEKNRFETIYYFNDCETRLSIESLIESDKIFTWNKLLADYYLEVINRSQYNSDKLTLCNNLMKCGFYLEKCGKNEESFTTYLKLIPLLMEMQAFYQAIDILTELLINEICKNDKRIKASLYYYNYICYKNVFQFKDALNYINKFIVTVKAKGKERLEISCNKAFFIYNCGLTRKAYEFLKTEYLNYKKNRKGSDIKLLIQVYSMLSSLEQTLNYKEYSVHFNMALKLAHNYKIYELYHILLRKSSLVFAGTTAVKYLMKAKKYFENKNDIEYAMSSHNLASEYIYLGESKLAQESLDIAFKILKAKNHNALNCVQIEYSIYYSIHYSKYEKAYQILEKVDWRYDEDFVKMVFYFNLSTICRKLGKIEKCKDYLSKMEEINFKEENNLPYFNKYKYAQKGYIAMAENQYNEALDYFYLYLNTAYKNKIENDLSIIYNIIILSDILNISIPAYLVENRYFQNEMAKSLCDRQLLFCELSFWE